MFSMSKNFETLKGLEHCYNFIILRTTMDSEVEEGRCRFKIE